MPRTLRVTIILLLLLHTVVSARTRKRLSSHLDEEEPRTYEGEDWEGRNFDVDEVKQVTVERKVPLPIFIEKIRHVPVARPIFIERRVPVVHVVPRTQHYHHHHYTEFHHLR